MQTISVPAQTYQSLLQKARAFDRILTVTKYAFPLDEYSAADIAQFKKTDRVTSGQKRAILNIIKESKSGEKI